MTVKYARTERSFPPLTPLKAVVNDDERALRRLEHPPALPSHCKPWVDANSFGAVVPFPYAYRLTVEGTEDLPRTRVEHAINARHRDVVGFFAPGYFTLALPYYLRTEPRIGLYVTTLPSSDDDRPLVRGLIETWWYPKPLFLVFRRPQPGATVVFEYGDPLCVLLPVVCGPPSVEEMSSDELAAVRDREAEYDEYLSDHPELRWTSAAGTGFSRRYRVWAARERRSSVES